MWGICCGERGEGGLSGTQRRWPWSVPALQTRQRRCQSSSCEIGRDAMSRADAGASARARARARAWHRRKNREPQCNPNSSSSSSLSDPGPVWLNAATHQVGFGKIWIGFGQMRVRVGRLEAGFG